MSNAKAIAIQLLLKTSDKFEGEWNRRGGIQARY
jgi:hypothetical protein